MRMFGLSKKKNLQERKLALVQQIKEIKSQLDSIKTRDNYGYGFSALKQESVIYR